MKHITILLVFFIYSVSFAQSFTGKVLDKSNEPIAFANITAIQQSDSKIINGVISDENGNFSIDLKNKKGYLKISFIGFITKKIYPTKTDLGTIILQEENEQLAEVTITARKKIIEQKVDRLVFNVENSVAGSGGTANDVLQFTTGVTINNDKIEIVGKGTVKVMINDRIVQLSGSQQNGRTFPMELK